MQLSATKPPRSCSSSTLCGCLEEISCHLTVLDQIYSSYTWEFSWFVSGYAVRFCGVDSAYCMEGSDQKERLNTWRSVQFLQLLSLHANFEIGEHPLIRIHNSEISDQKEHVSNLDLTGLKTKIQNLVDSLENVPCSNSTFTVNVIADILEYVTKNTHSLHHVA